MKTGDRIGRYELGRRIGEGAIAEVYATEHPDLNQQVALKSLKKEVCADEPLVARFLEDARAAAGLDHPKVVRVLEADDSDGQPFIVMELVEGGPLDRWIAGRSVGIAEAARIGRDVAEALAAAHAAGLIHRNVKPSNVLIDRTSGSAKLTDFGVAKDTHPEGMPTKTGQRIAMSCYMAPEQVEGSGSGPRSDIFALGATLYELLAGRPAFGGKALSALFHDVLFNNPPPLDEIRSNIPSEIVELVDQCLAKAPEIRPSSATEVASVLEPFVVDPTNPLSRTPSTRERPEVPMTEVPTLISTGTDGSLNAATAPKPGHSEATSPPRNPLPATIAGGAALLLLTGLGAALFLGGGDSPLIPEEARTEPTPAPTAAPAPGPEVGPETVAGSRPAPAPTQTAASAPETDPEPIREQQQDVAGMSQAAEPEPEAPAPGLEPPAKAEMPELPFDLGCSADAPGCKLAERALNALGRPDVPPPVIKLNRPDGIYFDEDSLVIITTAPTTLGGYLFIDVLTDDGEVYHLLPEPVTPEHAIAPGEKIQVGVEEAAPGVRHWQVSGPFGDGYVLATVSEQPIYEGLRPIAEPLDQYEPILIDALADRGLNRIALQLERVEFRPRE